jgi:hypothetical protein
LVFEVAQGSLMVSIFATWTYVVFFVLFLAYFLYNVLVYASDMYKFHKAVFPLRDIIYNFSTTFGITSLVVLASDYIIDSLATGYWFDHIVLFILEIFILLILIVVPLFDFFKSYISRSKDKKKSRFVRSAVIEE